MPQHFHSYGKNKIHMHVWSIKYELYNFDDSIYKLNAFIFVFKTDMHNI